MKPSAPKLASLEKGYSNVDISPNASRRHLSKLVVSLDMIYCSQTKEINHKQSRILQESINNIMQFKKSLRNIDTYYRSILLLIPIYLPFQSSHTVEPNLSRTNWSRVNMWEFVGLTHVNYWAPSPVEVAPTANT